MSNKPSRCPDRAATIGHMIEAEVRCSAWCADCFSRKGVDLLQLSAIKGAGFVLWGKRARCRITTGCRGRVCFYLEEDAGRTPMWDY